MKTLGTMFIRYRLPLVVLGVFLMTWELIIRFAGLPAYILPGPGDILATVPSRYPDLLSSFFTTLGEAIAGFALSAAIGMFLSLIFASSRVIRRSLLPYVVLLQTIPIIAVSPLVILWMGNGTSAVCFIAFMICIPAVITNMTQGLISVDQNLIDLFRMSNASTVTTLLKLRLPYALPSIFTGLRIASGASVVGAIVGETFAGSSAVGQGGLGYASIYALDQTQTPYLFALVLASSLMGLSFFLIVSTAEWFCLRHWHDSVIADQPI